MINNHLYNAINPSFSLNQVNRKIIEREKGDVQQAVEINYISFRKGERSFNNLIK